jgi:lipopolysaccharide transport system permease protein
MDSQALKNRTSGNAPEILLGPRTSVGLFFRDLWRFRELLAFLAWRDVLLRYKQAAFGIGWALLRPLLTLVIFTLVFQRVAGIGTDGVPYPLFALSGMLIWQFFAGCAADASQSLVANSSLVTKVFFPRLILPSSVTLVNLLDFAVTLPLFAALWIYHGAPPPGPLWALPLVLVWMLVVALGTGFWLSAATVRFRDVKFLVPFALQIGLYASPVAYPVSALPEKVRLLSYLNPLAGLIEALRWSCFGAAPSHTVGVWISLAAGVAIFVSGFVFFRRLEDSFADII